MLVNVPIMIVKNGDDNHFGSCHNRKIRLYLTTCLSQSKSFRFCLVPCVDSIIGLSINTYML